jgi:hypothetical protein
MKKSELQELIREVIDEVMNEATQSTTIDFKDKNRGDKILDIDPSDAPTINKLKIDPNVASVTMGTKKLKEMARQPIIYKVSDDYADKLSELPYVGSSKRMVWVNGIIDYIKDNGPADITKIAREKFNVPQPRISDYARDMIRLGILAPTTAGVVPQFMKPKAEPGEEVEPEEETGIVSGDLSDEEIEASFAQAKAAGDEEESTPELGKVPTPSSASGLSDEDYNTFMKYTDLADRLNKVKSDLNRMKRAKFMAGTGDIKDKSSTEEKRLMDLKASLEQRVNNLVASSEYLQKRQSKKDELDEWNKNKMQYYAGIIK